MSKIAIVDLEVRYSIGVGEEERAQPQRLLLTIEMEFDITAAAASDRVEQTINYKSIADDLLQFGNGRSWRLLERLVCEIADRIMTQYKPQSAFVEAKKFVIPQARYVAVSVRRGA